MGSLKSRWKEQSGKSTKSTVVGRQQYINTFISLYETCGKREATVLDLYGVGGIGKSTILNSIRHHAKQKQIPCFFYDLEKHSGVLQFYEQIYTWLQTVPFKSYYFQMGFLIYWQRMNPNIDFKESLPTPIEEGGLLADIVSAMINDNAGLIKDAVPVLGSVSTILYKSYRKLSIRYQLEKELIDYIGEMESNDVETDEIERRLPYLLMQDLQRADIPALHRPLFLFDTYEKLYESATVDKRRNLEAWIENFAAGILDRGMLVIAGREKLDWSGFDDAWNNLIVSCHIEALSDDEAKILIRSRGIEAPQIIDSIVDASKGHPFYIELAVDTYKSAPEDFDSDAMKATGQEQIFKRFVGNLGAEYLTILEHLSVTRDFDRNLYEYIVQEAGIGYSQLIFEQLVSYSFFTRKDDRYTMHDLMRRSFQLHIDPQRLQKLHKIVFLYYEEKITEAFDEDRLIESETLHASIHHLFAFADEQKIEQWFSLINKMLHRHGDYRLLAQLYNDALGRVHDRKMKIRFMLELGMLYIDLDAYESLKFLANELEHTIVPVDLLDDIAYLKAIRDLMYAEKLPNSKKRDRLMKSIEKALGKVILKSDTKALKTRAYIETANLLRKREEYFRAQSILYTALRFTDDPLLEAKIYDKIGFLQRDMHRYDDARSSFINAIRIKKGLLAPNHIELGKSYRGLSQILIKLKLNRDACEVKQKAIAAFEALYGKWSVHVREEYKNIIKHCPEKLSEALGRHDNILWLIANLQVAVDSQNQERVIQTLETLKKNDEEITEKNPVIAKILINKFPEEAKRLLDEAQGVADSDVRRWNLTLQTYLIYRKAKYYDDAEKALKRLLDLSSRMELPRHISALQRAAFFYYKIRSDPLEAGRLYEYAIDLLLEKSGNRLKAAELSRMRAGLFKKDLSSKLHWLNKTIDLYRIIHRTHEEAEIMGECVKIYIKKKEYSQAEITLYRIIELYEKERDLLRMDSTIGKLADLYENLGRDEEALNCHYRQLKLRQDMQDDFRLAKGYKFLADYYIKKRNDPKKAEVFYRKGLEIALAGGTHAEEMIELHTFSLLRFYQKYDEVEKEKEMIDLRLEQARLNKSLTFQRLAQKDLEYFYRKKGMIKEAIQSAEYSLNLYPFYKFPAERLLIVKRLVKYTSIEKDSNRQLRFMLQKYELLLLMKKDEEATKCFMELVDLANKADLHQSFLQHYKSILGNFAVRKRYNAYASAIRHYRFYDPATRWRFIYEQLSRFQKLVGPQPDPFHRVHSRLLDIHATNEAALFYERYFNLRIAQMKGRFDKQEILYEEAMKKIRRMNNKVVTQRFSKKYMAFQSRLLNMHLVNGKAVDSVLKPILDDLLPTFGEEESSLQRFKHFLKRCENEPAFLKRIEERKLNPSVILQGIMAIEPDFSPLRYGFDSNNTFLQMLLSHTAFRLGRPKNQNSYIVILRDADFPEWEILSDITDCRSYIHEKGNYAKLLTTAFFEGEGLFFSRNPLLEQRFYRFMAENSFAHVTFDEIIESVLTKLNVVRIDDRQRVENLMRNLYYADCFLIENRYEAFEAQVLTQKYTGPELLKRLKSYGKEILHNMITDVDNRIYEQLWL